MSEPQTPEPSPAPEPTSVPAAVGSAPVVLSSDATDAGSARPARPAPTAPAPRPPKAPRRPGQALWVFVRELVLVIGMALVLALVVKTWLIQAFYIPSGSMESTLVLNDRVIVNKLVPSPVALNRGDVVVFEDPGGWLGEVPQVDRSGLPGLVHDGLVFVGLLPNESQDHLIKRVIGLPGDHVTCCTQGKVTVNGVPITEPYVKPGDAPSGVSFDITVPANKVWVMGDHRSDSEDSRFHDGSSRGLTGSVPIDRITGRAVATVWPLDRVTWLSDYESVFAKVPKPKG